MFFIIVLFIFIVLFYNYFWKRRNFPPGPPPLPLLGNVLEFDHQEADYKTFKKWKEKYGDIYTFWASEKPFVVLCDYQLLLDTLVKDGETYSGRICVGEFNPHVRGGEFGVVFIDGDLWKEHRRFAIQVFRNFGMGKNVMEEKIQLELGYFFEDIEISLSRGENIQNLIPKIEITVASIINQLLFGFAYHEKAEVEKFTKIKETINKHMQIATYPGTLFAMHYPKIAPYLPILKDRYHGFISGYKIITEYCKEQIAAHKAKRSTDAEPNDYVDAYLREAELKGKDNTFTEVQLINALYDIFIAGQETTANTIIFSVIYALNYPEKLKKLYNELDKVIGSDRRITLADRNSLSYCNAFIYEVQRLVNLLPQNLPHKLTKDVEIRGYKIPKNTVILPQVSSVLYDEKAFPNPETFIPERFLDSEGQPKRIDEFIPFSLGKRQCLGESLAKMELYLIIANFFNQYKLEPENGSLPSMKKVPGVTVQPHPFKCSLKKRY
uniref:Cytochrome P450 n=1 Tax=Panagrolaimus sp. PS1159 TaxID=55785 RepID=A0AC35FRH0_9BILA